MGTFENLQQDDAQKKLKELAESIRTCMFCTNLAEKPFATRPMAVQEVDEQGNIWFISSADSNKNVEIKQDEEVQLIFAQPSDAHFLSVYGKAYIYTDKNTIEDKWTPMAKAWFKEGKDDPKVTVIRVQPSESYYWDTKNGKMITMLKIAASLLTGNTHDEGGVEGKLKV